MKKSAILLVLVILGALLSGCDLTDYYVPETKPTTLAPSESTGNIDWKDGELCAIAFLGYADSLQDADMQPVYDSYAEQYSISRDAEQSLWIELEGDEVYLIIPRYEESALGIHKVLTGKVLSSGEVLYSGDAKPLFLRCNLSDIHPNSSIVVSHRDTNTDLAPSRNLVDGNIILPPDGTVRDVTIPQNGDAPYQKSGAASVAMSGDWQMLFSYNDENFVQGLNFTTDNKMTMFHGWAESELAEKFTGEYTFAGDNHPQYPVGTLLYTLNLVYAIDDEYVSEKTPGYAIQGAYTVEFTGDDVMKLTRLGGDQLVYNEHPPTPEVYTFNRAEEAVG